MLVVNLPATVWRGSPSPNLGPFDINWLPTGPLLPYALPNGYFGHQNCWSIAESELANICDDFRNSRAHLPRFSTAQNVVDARLEQTTRADVVDIDPESPVQRLDDGGRIVE